MPDSTAPATPRDPQGRFRNRFSREAHGPSWALLKFLWSMRTTPFAVPAMPRGAPDLAFLRANRTRTALTFIGHASYLVQAGGRNVLTDPHLTARASPLGFAGPRRLNAPGLDFPDLPAIDLVLISHNHYDHLDRATVHRLAREHAPQFVVPRGLAAWFRREGIARVTELDWWQDATVAGLDVTAVPVQHFSGRSATDRNRTLWCGFVFGAAPHRIFFAGDSGYSPDFAEIGERCGPIDVALLPIGAYAPRSFMRPVHADPEEAVRMHQDLRARLSLAMHWGTFRLTTEPLDEPPQRLAAALAAAGIPAGRFRVPRLGETILP